MDLTILGVKEYSATVSAGEINRMGARYQGWRGVQDMSHARRFNYFKGPLFTHRTRVYFPHGHRISNWTPRGPLSHL